MSKTTLVLLNVGLAAFRRGLSSQGHALTQHLSLGIYQVLGSPTRWGHNGE